MKCQTTLFYSCLVIATSGIFFTACGNRGNTDHARTENTVADLPQTAGRESLTLVPGASAGTLKLDEPDSLIRQHWGSLIIATRPWEKRCCFGIPIATTDTPYLFSPHATWGTTRPPG